MKKRIVSILVILCMILVQLPVIAFASQEAACITGLSITVDGVIYTEGNVTIKPDSTILYTVTGTNLDQLAEGYTLGHASGVRSSISAEAGWVLGTTNTTLSRDYSDRVSQFVRCDNFQVCYNSASGEQVCTDIYLTYDAGNMDAEPAQITGLGLLVDGVTYTEGNVTIKPGCDISLIIYGTNLMNGNTKAVIDTPRVYISLASLSVFSDHIVTYEITDSWFAGASDYPITYTNDNWATTVDSGITVTYDNGVEGPAEITQVAITVDGVTYTEGNVIVRPESTVSFTVTGLNLQNANQMQIIDTPLAYLPLHSVPLQEDGTYLYTTVASIFVGGNHYNITYTNDSWTTSVATDLYVTYREGNDVISGDWTLTEDSTVQLSLTEDLYIDLNGFDLSGTIALNGYKVYGIDSATKEYTMDTMGYFSCVDENGNAIIPEGFYTTDDGMRYMTIETEKGYTFHRFNLEITHLSLNTAVTGFGYMAEFCGDEMVQAQVESIGYNLWLTEDIVVSRTTAFQNTWTLQLRNYDVLNYGETPVHACVSMTLVDGTVLKSETASYSMRQMVEMINHSTQDYETETLQRIARMILDIPPMETWQVENILAA